MWNEEMQGGIAQSNSKKSDSIIEEKKVRFSAKVDEDENRKWDEELQGVRATENMNVNAD